MDNPWNNIPLSDYEGHMSCENVMQMQTLNSMIDEQLGMFDVKSAVILGIAGGNGLEHADRDKYEHVYAVDVNAEYLAAAKQRYGDMDGVLKYLCIDLVSGYEDLPRAELVIADLLIEYIGYECFSKIITHVRPKCVSCGIQVDIDDAYVSKTPYIHAFDCLDSIHIRIDEDELSESLYNTGYELIRRTQYPLPNGKKLVRLDYTGGADDE